MDYQKYFVYFFSRQISIDLSAKDTVRNSSWSFQRTSISLIGGVPRVIFHDNINLCPQSLLPLTSVQILCGALLVLLVSVHLRRTTDVVQHPVPNVRVKPYLTLVDWLYTTFPSHVTLTNPPSRMPSPYVSIKSNVLQPSRGKQAL